MTNFLKNKKILVVGAGSGRDIASAILITEKYKNNNEVDLAGFLTPWALHTFDNELEKPINHLTNKQVTKFIANNKDKKLNSLFEPELLTLNKELNLGIRNFYLFSLQYGIKKLKRKLKKLIKENNYNLIIIVDTGGDILARKQDLRYVFTPIVDFSCLELFSSINLNVEKQLIVIAPGVDGELNKKQFANIFKELDRKGIRYKTELINREDKNYKKFIKTFKEINHITKSNSYTGTMIKNIVERKISFTDELEYKRVLKVKNREWTIKFPVKFASSKVNKIFYFNFNDIRNFNKIIVKYNNIIEAFHYFKNLGVGGTEIDLTYVPKKIIKGTYENYLFVLNIFNRVNNNTKKEIEEFVLSQNDEILKT